jgi:two-component system response regulator
MSSKYVLLVDDNPDDLDLALRALQRAQVATRVASVGDPLEALARLTGAAGPALHPLPSLVLLDLKMPRMNGTDLVRRLRAHPRTRLVPIVLLTSSGERRDIVEAYAAGANGYVRKPTTSEPLTDALRAICSYWIGFNEVPPQQTAADHDA